VIIIWMKSEGCRLAQEFLLVLVLVDVVVGNVLEIALMILSVGRG
jgi:hypothetical protein